MATSGGVVPDGLDADEYTRFQELSQSYQPESTGPLVSNRMSTAAIAEEYSRADPTYRIKTANIPQQYAQYRTCRGDGHCGWRAVLFCYFETVLLSRPSTYFDQEIARITSLSNLLQSCGLEKDIWEDWEGYTLDLLKALLASSSYDAGHPRLMSAFNEEGDWMPIMTYIKLLTGAYMRSNADQFAPFCSPEPVSDFAARNVEAAQCEIEHIGLSALYELLLKPASIAMEILYLDRSEGASVVPHRFEPDIQSSNVELPTIRLLYRPGHYDILYALSSQQLGTNYADQNSTDRATTIALARIDGAMLGGIRATPFNDIGLVGLVPMLPGMSMIGSTNTGSDELWYGSDGQLSGYMPTSTHYPYAMSTMAVSTMPDNYITSLSVPGSEEVRGMGGGPTSAFDNSFNSFANQFDDAQHAMRVSTVDQQCRPAPPNAASELYEASSIPLSSVVATSNNGPQVSNPTHSQNPKIEFRPSKWAYAYDQTHERTKPALTPHQQIGTDSTFTTRVFKQTHFNTCHFLNPKFQPEAWKPDDEAVTQRPSNRRKNTTP